MATVQRYDEAQPFEPEILPSGAVRIAARLTRTGVLPYLQPDGSVRREYRPPAEVFDPASLATVRGVAVTDLHPDEAVSPANWRKLATGHVGDDVRADGPFVAASVVVHDADELERIRSGERREISMGYSADLELTAGVSPEGEFYDAIQRSIRYNHAALGPEGWGRAGPLVRLRLDAAEVACSAPVMPDPQITKLETDLAEARKRADALEASIADRVKVRVALISAAQARGLRADAEMSDDELIGSIVAQAFPALDLTGVDHPTLMWLLKAATSLQAPEMDSAEETTEKPKDAPRMDAATLGRLPVPEAAKGKPVPRLDDARARAAQRDASRFRPAPKP